MMWMTAMPTIASHGFTNARTIVSPYRTVRGIPPHHVLDHAEDPEHARIEEHRGETVALAREPTAEDRGGDRQERHEHQLEQIQHHDRAIGAHDVRERHVMV